MSEDLIKRSDAIRVVRHSSMEFIDADTRQKLIEAIPTIEPKQGEWIPVDNGHHVRCSECGRCGFASDNYCGNCGAEMRGADDE